MRGAGPRSTRRCAGSCSASTGTRPGRSTRPRAPSPRRRRPRTSSDLSLEQAREAAGTLATSEEELCLVALFGEGAFPLLESLRGRHRHLSGEDGGADAAEGERIQRLIGILEESDLAELSLEDGDVRITLRKADQRPLLTPSAGRRGGPAAAAADDRRTTP